MTKSEAGRLGGLAAKRRHRWSREDAREAGRKGGEASAARRRCGGCGRVLSSGEGVRGHECSGGAS